MLISYNWLKQYINLPDSTTPEEVAGKLKASTVEVEGIKKLGENLDGVVVGKVVSAEKHPDADKLKLCQVDIGNEKVQIVCGGSNVHEGMLVALAKVGAKVRWHGEGELIELAPAKIRGVESFGMICASTEIGLGGRFPLKDEKEIVDLAAYNYAVGIPLAKALGLDDVVLEIDNKTLSNRPDLWGHYGIAREVAALFNKSLVEYKTEKISKLKKASIGLSVEVKDTKMCPRYMAVAMKGIKIGPSPEWLKQKLSAVGLNSINNIVDITNYVMMDLGQPMHAFDASHLNYPASLRYAGQAGLRIVVRNAVGGEKLRALDGNEYELSENDLVIADDEKVLALAGVIGGVDSAISDTTTEIIFESANFNPVSVRKTSTRLGIRTDSAQRFEKSLDPNLCVQALEKAVELTKQLCPGAMESSAVADEKNFQLHQGPIELNPDYFQKKIGADIDKKEIVGILQRLGFVVKEKKGKLVVTIPSWRATKDVSIAEDLVEEVLRLHGYNNVPAELPHFSIKSPEVNTLRKLEIQVKKILALSAGYTEVYNYSFVAPELLAKFGLETNKFIELENPIAKDRPFLRRDLVSGLVENLEKNQYHSERIALFEVGNVFNIGESGARVSEKSDVLLPRQDSHLGIVYSQKGEDIPYYHLISVLTKLSKELRVEFILRKSEDARPYFHPGRTAEIFVGENKIGVVGELHLTVQLNMGIMQRVAILELNLDQLNTNGLAYFKYEPLSPYPAVVRDVAFLIDKTAEHKKIIDAIQYENDLVVSVNLFDVFEGKNIPKDKKSMAYRIVYQSKEKTLATDEVERVHKEVLSLLKDKFGAEIR